MDVQFIISLKFGTLSKHFTQSSTTFENAPFSVSQYWYCNVALVCRSLSTSAVLALSLGPWQVSAHAFPAAVRLGLFGYAKTHQSKENFMLTAKNKQLVSVMQFCFPNYRLGPETYIKPSRVRSPLKAGRRQYWRVRMSSTPSTFVPRRLNSDQPACSLRKRHRFQLSRRLFHRLCYYYC